MRRREFITPLGSAAASLVSDAHAQQQPGRVRVLGVVPPTADMLSIFRDGLGERGYVEGQNLSIDVRRPQGSSFERNPGVATVATELVRSNVDAIVTWATEATMAAGRATLTIPIVMLGTGDPLGMHFIASLAHPGGNLTGVTNISPDLAGKLIELFVEIAPGMNASVW
jgi:putative ABC transport system substrate-binding protein